MDEVLKTRLKDLWDGQSEYVMDGPRHYRVLTPDGVEDPVFVPMQEGGYGDLSTGFPQAPEPKVAKPAVAKAAKPKTPKAKKVDEPIVDADGNALTDVE